MFVIPLLLILKDKPITGLFYIQKKYFDKKLYKYIYFNIYLFCLLL